MEERSRKVGNSQEEKEKKEKNCKYFLEPWDEEFYKIRHLRIMELIGSGSFGKVYKCRESKKWSEKISMNKIESDGEY